MSRALRTETHRGLTVELHVDEDCSSPRENDNLGTIIGWHRNYRLSDDYDRQPPMSPQEWREQFDEEHPDALILPIYMYEHSGVALSCRKTGQFADRWDAGQVGWIYVTAEKLRAEYGKYYPEADWEKHATDVLVAEVEEYGRYVNGECYGYVVEDEDGNHIDSCWGFIGDEYAWEEAIRAADYEAEERLKRADALTDAQRSEN